MKTRLRTVAVLAAASSLMVAAPHAGAGTGDLMVYTTDAGHPAAFAWWHPYGEHWGVCDDQKDGKRAVVQLVDIDAGVQYGLVDATGYDNTCARANVNFNLAEGHRIKIRVCLRDGALGPFSSCSAWKQGHA